MFTVFILQRVAPNVSNAQSKQSAQAKAATAVPKNGAACRATVQSRVQSRMHNRVQSRTQSRM